MYRHFLFLFFILFLFTCNNNKEKKANNTLASSKQETPAIPKVTVLANLSDSLLPKTILLENTPKPERIKIPDKPVIRTIQSKSKSEIIQFGPTEKTQASLLPFVQNYTTEQGLAQDVVSCCYADKKGNLWFGTWVGGVSKYDGKSFTNYTTSNGLPSNEIYSITGDKAGNIWFATILGVSKFDGAKFSTFGNFKNVTSILEDKAGNFWFGTGNGLFKYSGDSITSYTERDGLASNYIHALKEDQKGILWVGTDKGLFRFDARFPDGQGKRFKNIAASKEDVYSICIDKSGSIWAGIVSGYIKYDGVNITSYPFPFSTSLRFVYEDRFGNVWLDGSKDGIWYYNPKLGPQLNKCTGLNFVGMPSILEDNSGNLWFCTSSGGVVKFSGQAFQQLTNNSIRSIFEDKNRNIWFAGYSRNVTMFDGENFTNYGIDHDIYCIFQDKSGKIWLASEEKGLIKFEDNSFTFYTELNGLVNDGLRFITQDTEGFLWIGTKKGLSKFDGKSFTNFTTKQGLAADFVSCILEDKPGELILGTDRGLSIFDGKSFTNYSISQLYKGNDIKSLVKDKNGNLWIATYGGGLIRYDGKSFYGYTTEQGLPDNVVTQVALTKEGHIIVGTNNGIALLTGFKPVSNKVDISIKTSANRKKYSAQNYLTNSELKNFSPVFEIYNPKTGYPIMDVNRGQKTVFEDSKGILWIASGSEKSGLMRFDYSSIYKNKRPPDINILAVKIDNELVCWRDLLHSEKNDQKPTSRFESIAVTASVNEEVTTFGNKLSNAQREEMQKKYREIEFDAINQFYPVPQNLKLPYNHNRITIEFAAIEPDKPLLVQYQYMLEGYDKNWSTPANINSATFGNMYEGTYQFKLKAQSQTGVWSEPITYSFTVLPPWWRTWWAYTIFALMFLFAFRAFVIWRERKLRKEKEKLEKTVEIRTSEVVAEKKKSDDLLLNILPEEVAEELKAKGSADAKHFDEVTVMFTDFKGFTQISEKLSPTELVAEIHTCFKAFDDIICKHNIEKIKTIGDSYMCAGGLPVTNKTNAIDIVCAALEIQQFMQLHFQQRKKENKEPFEIRIGIHTGPVVAGIVGVKKFAYDIWGDTVNIASRMESSGEAGKVNISGSTYELVKDKFNCTNRGKILAKNKGEIDMYFVEAVIEHEHQIQ